MTTLHTTVMLEETLRFLAPEADCLYVDATVGLGGHTEAILAASAPSGRVLGFDRDADALELARERLRGFGDRVALIHGDFESIATVLESRHALPIDGFVADLGVSSIQLDRSERGFSFARPGPIDMRMNRATGRTAADLLDDLDESELADLLFQLAGERRSRAIARAIKRAVASGQMQDTSDLRRAVLRATGPRRGRSDPATRTFLALRLAVNDELTQLQRLIQVLPDLLRDDATAVVISFHSSEDRIVKRAFREDPRLVVRTKRPLCPTQEEQAANARSRSAKLRAACRAPRSMAA